MKTEVLFLQLNGIKREMRKSVNKLCPPYPICIEENIGIQETGNCPIKLWGNLYLIEDTYALNLSGDELSGPIPPDIGNLTI